MNGSFPRAYFTFAGSPPAPHPGADWKRLYAALIVSCLLHAALFLMPDFGTSAPVSRSAARSAQKPGAARALDVSLQQASGSAATAAGKSAARGADLLPIPAPTYYRTAELTKPPRPTSELRLDMPRSVARSVTGKVVLKLWISALGKVDSVEVESSNLPDTVSELTAAAFGKVRFLPGEIDGRRVRALMRIEVAYVNGKRPPP